MANMTAKLAIAAALVATAGCAKKRPEVLPPAPAETAPTATPQPTDNSNMVQPGSAQDFKQSVVDDTIHFGLDQYDIDPQARSILDSQAQWLMKYPNVRITIEGHTDERGTREYNLALGDRTEPAPVRQMKPPRMRSNACASTSGYSAPSTSTRAAQSEPLLSVEVRLVPAEVLRT